MRRRPIDGAGLALLGGAGACNHIAVVVSLRTDVRSPSTRGGGESRNSPPGARTWQPGVHSRSGRHCTYLGRWLRWRRAVPWISACSPRAYLCSRSSWPWVCCVPPVSPPSTCSQARPALPLAPPPSTSITHTAHLGSHAPLPTAHRCSLSDSQEGPGAVSRRRTYGRRPLVTQRF